MLPTMIHIDYSEYKYDSSNFPFRFEDRSVDMYVITDAYLVKYVKGTRCDYIWLVTYHLEKGKPLYDTRYYIWS